LTSVRQLAATLVLCACALLLHPSSASAQLTVGPTNTWTGRLINITGPSSLSAPQNTGQFEVDYAITLAAGVTDTVIITNGFLYTTPSLRTPATMSGFTLTPGSEIEMSVVLDTFGSGGPQNLLLGDNTLNLVAVGFDSIDYGAASASASFVATVTAAP